MSDKKYLTSIELARRWKVKPQTLRNQRHRHEGPPYTKPFGPRGPARYDLADVEAWERTHEVRGGESNGDSR